jgi:hypothetical protein
MKTMFLIFISSLIRAYEYPRIDGFVHTTEFKDVLDADGKPLGERYVYLGRALTIDEFNAASARVFSENFPGEDRTFRAFAIDPDAEAKHAEARAIAAAEAEAATLAAAEAEAARTEAEAKEAVAAAEALAEKEAEEREIARKSREAVLAATRKLDAENAAEQKRLAAEEAKALVAPVDRPTQLTVVGELPAAADFVLDGKNIMSGGVRVAGLFGDDKQLRVPSAHADLRPAIEAWLATNPQ